MQNTTRYITVKPLYKMQLHRDHALQTISIKMEPIEVTDTMIQIIFTDGAIAAPHFRSYF
jgi:hypothetical protein